MQVVYHLGAHCTDEDRLVRCLIKNRGFLGQSGIVVPSPMRYRPVFREMQSSLRGQPTASEVQEVVLDAVMDEDRAERLIFSHEFFLCVPSRVVSPQGFYAVAHRKLRALANIFPDSPAEFHLSIRNPATLIAELLAKAKHIPFEDLMGDADPLSLRWLPVIERCVNQNPDLKLVVWCNEDTPLIWPDVIRRVAGVAPDTPMDGDFDLIATLVGQEDLAAIQKAVAAAGVLKPADRRDVFATLLQRHVNPAALDFEINLPGWSQELVARMTEIYEADAAAIAAIPEIEFLAP